MKSHVLRLLPVLTLALALALGSGAVVPAEVPPAMARPDYPPTPVHEVADTLHGTVLIDPYRWLEDADDPAVEAWTEAQNAFTSAWLARFPRRAELTAKFDRLYGINTVLSARPFGTRLFVERKDGLQNHAVVFVHEGGLAAPAKVAIDPNGFSADGTVAMDWWYPSPDGSLIAYGKSAGGSEMSTLHVRDVTAGGDRPDSIPDTQRASVAWDPDGRGFLYSRHPAKGEVPAGEEVFRQTIRHHRLGDDPARDPVVWSGDGAPIQEIRWVAESSDHQWHFLYTSLDWSRNDLYARRAGTDEPFLPLARGLDGRTSADCKDGRFYLLTNVGAPRYRIVSVEAAGADTARWRVVVPEQAGVIEAFALAGGRLVLNMVENASSQVVIHTLDGRREKALDLPALGTVASLAGRPDGDALYFQFRSFTWPTMVWRYDFATGGLAAIDHVDLPFDPAAYETRQVWTTSQDGTRVPMFVVQKKGLAWDGDRPTLLYSYGGFEVNESPHFRAAIFPWLDDGGVYCVANLRGGGEFGRAWHEAARLERKQNTFDDLYGAAQWLLDHKVTCRERLACEGGSNGGLTVGAALVQRPDLWGAVLCEVPLLDMIRYQRFSIARYWVPEYGSAEDSTQFRFLLAYSPYQNVKAGVAYPATLLTAGASDTRVDALHARKMAALLQARTAGDAPILLRVEGRAGHGQGKPTSKRVAEAVDTWGFLMQQFGMDGSAAGGATGGAAGSP